MYTYICRYMHEKYSGKVHAILITVVIFRDRNRDGQVRLLGEFEFFKVRIYSYIT